jgi:hypothetical protein
MPLFYLISITIAAQIQPLQPRIIAQILENPGSTIIIQIIEPETQVLQRVIGFERIAEIRYALIANLIIRKIDFYDDFVSHD